MRSLVPGVLGVLLVIASATQIRSGVKQDDAVSIAFAVVMGLGSIVLFIGSWIAHLATRAQEPERTKRLDSVSLILIAIALFFVLVGGLIIATIWG